MKVLVTGANGFIGKNLQWPQFSSTHFATLKPKSPLQHYRPTKLQAKMKR